MSDLLKALAVTAEVMGVEWSEAAAELVAGELRGYEFADVQIALKRCIHEVRGKLTLHEILERIPGGHPGPEEAWAIVSKSMGNEAITIVWTDEMREAYGVASALAADPVAARMAFKEKYQEAVSAARAARSKPAWRVSLGFDARGREGPVLEAFQKGRLSRAVAQQFAALPEPAPEIQKLIAGIL